ncbi:MULTISPECIES: QueT transporter family protein [Haloferax]|uniref:QueT transporter family protein n=1 Tax=Haloferax marinum TaxID=2666143 RepID=A0A6A8G8L1_9EURY|nr:MULTISPECIES: QueT transporter family protein [Haloferax]KAB1197840.1 QueT transporter family protein [Haloferax sp. CBA1150]MRW96902.1 QueT transporter family protein [Haloferax marinum]
MIALTAVIAAVYMTALIPFKGFAIVPGFTEVRPAIALPVALGLLFGPATAWGAAIGNLLSDAFGGTLSAGSAFGFVGNFFSGFVAYKLWGHLGPLSSNERPTMRSLPQLAEFVVISFVSAAGTAAIIAWGLDLLGLFPFSLFAAIIAFNNFLAAAILGPPILYLLYPRIESAGLLYMDILDERDLPDVSPRNRRIAASGLATVAAGWLVGGTVIGITVVGIPFDIPVSGIEPGTGGSTVQAAFGAVAFVLLLGFSALSAGWFAGEREFG